MMDVLTENIWIANVATATVITGVIAFFFKRYVDQNDTRMDHMEKKAEAAKIHGETIDKTYIKRFEDVHKVVNHTKEEIKDHFTKEIKEVVHDKNNYRQQQAILTTEISRDVTNLVKSFEEYKKDNKK